MRNTTKFVSQFLELKCASYEFLKLSSNFWKAFLKFLFKNSSLKMLSVPHGINPESHRETDSRDPRVNRPHMAATEKGGRGLTSEISPSARCPATRPPPTHSPRQGEAGGAQNVARQARHWARRRAWRGGGAGARWPVGAGHGGSWWGAREIREVEADVKRGKWREKGDGGASATPGPCRWPWRGGGGKRPNSASPLLERRKWREH
jgi:hypothetical protein